MRHSIPPLSPPPTDEKSSTTDSKKHGYHLSIDTKVTGDENHFLISPTMKKMQSHRSSLFNYLGTWFNNKGRARSTSLTISSPLSPSKSTNISSNKNCVHSWLMNCRVQLQVWRECLLGQHSCKLIRWFVAAASVLFVVSFTLTQYTLAVSKQLPQKPSLESILLPDREVMSISELETRTAKFSKMNKFKLVGPFENLSLSTVQFPAFPNSNELPRVPDNLTFEDILDNQYRYSNTIYNAMKEWTSQSPVLQYVRANACIYILCRNKDLKDILHSMSTFEFAFNSRYQYPYVFLNDEPFTDEFKHWVSSSTSSKVEFGVIPKEDWSLPQNINRTEFEDRLQVNSKRYLYGGSESYRYMCRYNSRLFYKHPLMMKYRYYWRMEPDIDYGCMIRYDPLLFMALSKKRYGFTIVADELLDTVTGLWNQTASFVSSAKIPLSPFLKEAFYNPSTRDFNGNHFWSNFEIADLEFYRSELYEAYMKLLDESKGFFLERYGDAPVHSLAVGMLLKPEEVHHFADISYHHENHGTCPVPDEEKAKKKRKEKPSTRSSSSGSAMSSMSSSRKTVAVRYVTDKDQDIGDDSDLDSLRNVCWCKRDSQTWSEGMWWSRNLVGVLRPLNALSYQANFWDLHAHQAQ